MKPLKMLHRGFDRLEIAYRTALAPSDVEILEEARKEAETNLAPVLVKIGHGRIAMHVAESGLKGGYAFRTDTGPTGEVWAFKRGLSRNDWNVRVAIKSLGLATRGLAGTRKHLQEMLIGMGIDGAEESLGRIDYAVDYLMPPEFRLDARHFVSHSKSTKREHSVCHADVKGNFAEELVAHWAGRKSESVTIGKMPGQQVIVYDKRREVVRHQKAEWFQIWGIDPAVEDISVWRVEIRAGKKHLKDWNVRTFRAMESRLGEVLSRIVSDTRYAIPSNDDANVSRWSPDALWQQVQADIKEGLIEHFDGTVRGRIVTGLREHLHQQFRAQILGLVPGALATMGVSEDEAYARRGNFLRSLGNEIERWESESFRRKLAKARSRMHFI